MSNNIPRSERHSHDPVDLQVIGGGLAGLIAANLALDAGLSVRLIEKQPSLGGRATSGESGGFVVNQGPHALYLSGELLAVLRELGIDPSGAPPKLKGALGSIGDRTDLLPQGPTSLIRTSLLPPRGKLPLMKFMARLPRLDTEPLATVTVDRWLRELTDVPELRTMIGGLVNLATYNSAATVASADAAVAQLKMALDDGVIYVDGGWGTIVNSLEARLDIGGGRRVVGTVTDLVHDGANHLATVDDGVYSAANTIVAPGSPAVAARLTGLAGLQAAAGPPVQASVMDIGIRGQSPVDIHLGLDSGLYFSSHSVAAGLAPGGHSLISVARYLAPGDDISAGDGKQLLLDHAIDVGVRSEDIVMSRYLHRLTVTWGMPMAERGGLAGRPSPSPPDRPGLHIAGDWVGNRGLLADASAASARDAVAAVVADRGRRAAAPVAS